MKDKEFDQLFKDRFEDAEVEPSSNLWNNIAKELKPRKKQVFSGYWVAAAAVLIIVSGVLLAPKEEKIRLGGEALVVSDQPLNLSETHPRVEEDTKVEPEDDINTYESRPSTIAPHLKEVNLKKELIAMQPVVPTIRLVVDQPDSIKVDFVIAKADVPDEINADIIVEHDTPTKGIRNVGDLVNYVVSKVDKREDKFLEFNTDDDNSSLVGINIGFIKLNLKRHK
jgi:hypothetical protein